MRNHAEPVYLDFAAFTESIIMRYAKARYSIRLLFPYTHDCNN